MQGYNSLKIFVIIFLIFYFIAGLSTELLLPGKQKNIPPFFSWFLFQYVPDQNNKTRYDVIITHVEGKKLDPPVLYMQAYGIVDNPASPKAREVINSLGQGIDRNRVQQIERFRRIFEQIYLPVGVIYEVATIRYDPIEFYKTNKYEVVKKRELRSRNYNDI